MSAAKAAHQQIAMRHENGILQPYSNRSVWLVRSSHPRPSELQPQERNAAIAHKSPAAFAPCRKKLTSLKRSDPAQNEAFPQVLVASNANDELIQEKCAFVYIYKATPFKSRCRPHHRPCSAADIPDDSPSKFPGMDRPLGPPGPMPAGAAAPGPAALCTKYAPRVAARVADGVRCAGVALPPAAEKAAGSSSCSRWRRKRPGLAATPAAAAAAVWKPPALLMTMPD